MDDSSRSLAWVGRDWAREVKPRVLYLENVTEFQGWGPLLPSGKPDPTRKGETFREFCNSLRCLGYQVDWRILVAADYGVPTSRKRLYLVAKRDGVAPQWPEPTHGPGRPKPWRTARECIDWSIPCPSIWAPGRALVPASLRRIGKGIRKFGSPYILSWYGQSIGSSLDAPLPTVTAGGGRGNTHLGLVVPREGVHTDQCAFLVKYYGTGGTQSLDAPLDTVTVRDRFGLVLAELGDVGLRMLQPRELARAMGFPETYRLEGPRTEQVARIGNAVCPEMARVLVVANRKGD